MNQKEGFALHLEKDFSNIFSPIERGNPRLEYDANIHV